jgi:hypothetical protein
VYCGRMDGWSAGNCRSIRSRRSQRGRRTSTRPRLQLRPPRCRRRGLGSGVGRCLIQKKKKWVCQRKQSRNERRSKEIEGGYAENGEDQDMGTVKIKFKLDSMENKKSREKRTEQNRTEEILRNTHKQSYSSRRHGYSKT